MGGQGDFSWRPWRPKRSRVETMETNYVAIVS